MPRSHLSPIAKVLFFSRWLQLPLYLGLIVAQGVYVWYFMIELSHLVEAAFGSKDALELILQERHAAGRRNGQGASGERSSCWWSSASSTS
jgi:uncharacterized membrane protein YqhA